MVSLKVETMIVWKVNGMVALKAFLLGNWMVGKMDESMVEQLVDVKVIYWVVS